MDRLPKAVETCRSARRVMPTRSRRRAGPLASPCAQGTPIAGHVIIGRCHAIRATSCSTSGVARGSNGSVSGWSTGRIRARSGRAREPDAWRAADLRFDRDRGWSGPRCRPAPGRAMLRRPQARAASRPMPGQVGLFPEHLGDARLAPGTGRTASDGRGRRRRSCTCSPTRASRRSRWPRAGAEVTHVDASRPTVGWARRNAELSGLADRPIRWIVDDALGVHGARGPAGPPYAGIVLDPPSYGHGPAARPWRLEEDLSACWRPALGCSSRTGSCS